MIISTALIFLISFTLFLTNYMSNQLIAEKSNSLLKDNYPSVKYSIEMLKQMVEINNIIVGENKNTSAPGLEAENTNTLKQYVSNFEKNLEQQIFNMTEPGEIRLTIAIQKELANYKEIIFPVSKNKFDYHAYRESYLNIREYLLELYDININVLEQDNQQKKKEIAHILKTQKGIAIGGLTILCLLVIFIPVSLIYPIDRFTGRLQDFYLKNFDKEIEIKPNNELEKMQELFEKIVLKIEREE